MNGPVHRLSAPLFVALFLSALPAAPGCNAEPDLTDEDSRLIEAYVDVLLLRESLSRSPIDSAGWFRAAVDSVLATRGFSEGEFREKFSSVPRDEERFLQLMREAEQELRRRRSPPPPAG